jgi:RNA polymerase sigma factor (sigma-70 family)
MVSAAASSPPGQSRDEEIAEFFGTWRKKLVGYLIVNGCPPHEADDIAQDSFMSVGDRWEHVRGLEQPRAYLFKVALRRWLRVRQDQARFVALDPVEHLSAFPAPADALRVAQAQADAMVVVGQLPLRQRQVFWLRDVLDFSEAETAEILTVNIGTVKSQLHEARKKLRELALKERGDDTR